MAAACGKTHHSKGYGFHDLIALHDHEVCLLRNMIGARNMTANIATFETPLQVRLACRENSLKTPASHALPGYLCVNVVCLDIEYADDFAAFCRANPRPCPLLKRFKPGQTDCPEYARDLDIRTDLGSYDILRDGVLEQRSDILELFNERTVTFLIGSSTSFEGILDRLGFPPLFRGAVQKTRVPCNHFAGFHIGMCIGTGWAAGASAIEDLQSRRHFPWRYGCDGAGLRSFAE